MIPYTVEVELEDYRVKKHWIVFNVELDENTKMKRVCEAAEKVLELPKSMIYRPFGQNTFIRVEFRNHNLFISHFQKHGWHRIHLFRAPCSDYSGNGFVGQGYWRGPNQTLENQLRLLQGLYPSFKAFEILKR